MWIILSTYKDDYLICLAVTSFRALKVYKFKLLSSQLISPYVKLDSFFNLYAMLVKLLVIQSYIGHLKKWKYYSVKNSKNNLIKILLNQYWGHIISNKTPKPYEYLLKNYII